MSNSLLFHGNNGYANAPQCDVIRTLALLLMWNLNNFSFLFDTFSPILFQQVETCSQNSEGTFPLLKIVHSIGPQCGALWPSTYRTVYRHRKTDYRTDTNARSKQVICWFNFMTNRRSIGRSFWPRRLRCRSAAARLLELRVRMPMGAWMTVACELVCCQLLDSAAGRSLVQRSPTDWVCVLLSVIRRNNSPLYLQWEGTIGQTEKERRILHTWHCKALRDKRISEMYTKIVS